MQPEVVKRTLSAMYFAVADAIGEPAARVANDSLKEFARDSVQAGDLETADLCLFLAEASEEALPQPDYGWLREMTGEAA